LGHRGSLLTAGRRRGAYMIKYQIGVLSSKTNKYQYKEDIYNTAEDAWNKAKELYDQHIDDNSYVQIKVNKIVR
jgi:hypothetical protein